MSAENVTFVNTAGDEEANVDLDDLNTAADALLLGLLERIGQREAVEEFVAGMTLIEGVPTAMLLAVMVRALVNDVLGNLRNVPEVSAYMSLFMAQVHRRSD